MTNISMSPEQLQQLVTSLTTAALQAAAHNSASSFADASFSYDGTRSHMKVEEFISAASVYKTVHNINDANAIRSLPLILKDEASTWWQGVKDGITVWAEFEKRLRHAFAPTKSGVMIFQELFSQSQPDDMLTETFVARCRALLSQFRPPGIIEEFQLDAVYTRLHLKIRKKVPRDSVKTFDELLNAVRNVEQLLREKPKETAAVAPTAFPTDKPKAKKQRCDFYRGIGHVTEECRKRMAKQATQEQTASKAAIKTEAAATQAPSPSRPAIVCYGCGAPGVIRSECPKCLAGTAVKMERTDFCPIDVKTGARPRPMVAIGIYDIVGTAFVDTCAKSSVASYQLYQCLRRRNCEFASQIVTVTLADGVKKREEILSITVPVKLCDRIIPTTFVVLPKARENKTLLGVGFIEKAGLVPNIAQRCFYFIDKPHVFYDMMVEDMEGGTVAQFEPISAHVVAPRDPRRLQPLEPATADEAPSGHPPKRTRRVFDGFVPDHLDFMYADAVQSIEGAKVDFSPRSRSLFPGFNEVALNALAMNTVTTGPLDGKQKQKLLDILNEHEETFTRLGDSLTTTPVLAQVVEIKPLPRRVITSSEQHWCRGRVVMNAPLSTQVGSSSQQRTATAPRNEKHSLWPWTA